MAEQIKTKDIARIRGEIATKQFYKCPICEGSLAVGIPALDHDHKTGQIRAVLCGLCNRNEGKVMKAMKYMAKSHHIVWTDPTRWLRNLADYLEYHEENPRGLIHPTFDIVKGKQEPKKRVRRKT